MSSNNKRKHGLSYACFRVVRAIVYLVYPRISIEGLENLPPEPCILVGNHAQMHGPLMGELHFPGKRAIWCAGQMMHLKEVPDYAFQDFWSAKPKYIRWFFRLLSYAIAPLSVLIFNNAFTIPVYHDTRLLTTFRETFASLNDGANIIIMPECAEPGNHIVNKFQDKFVDVARMHYKRSGVKLSFVPMYVCPKLRKLCLGQPTEFDPSSPIEAERARICAYLSEAITGIAEALPEHTVVPYNNVSKKLYPGNLPAEVKK